MRTPASERLRLHPRGRRTLASAIVGVLVVASVASGFLLASSISQSAALGGASAAYIPVEAEVELRTVERDANIQGLVVPSNELTIAPSPPSNTTRAVVTTAPPAEGTLVLSGVTLGAVSDRPLFALDLVVPLYRDLFFGAEGSDVTSLQNALIALGDGPGKVSGKFDRSTLDAVRALYRQTGYPDPGVDLVVSADLIVDIPADGALVESSAGIGDVIGADRPLVTLTVGSPVVRGRMSVVAERLFLTGAEVAWSGPDGSAGRGVIGAVSDFLPADGQQSVPGFDFAMEFVDGEPPAPSTTVTVASLSQQEPTLAVPSVALRQDADGTYVQVPRGSVGSATESEAERVPVTVIRQADGWAAIAEGGLTVGDRVLVH